MDCGGLRGGHILCWEGDGDGDACGNEGCVLRFSVLRSVGCSSGFGFEDEVFVRT